jgi:hypothetical protein
VESGTLYINPNNKTTTAVKPLLTCVEEVPGSENGFDYIAHFNYENLNSLDIYIPFGTDNILSGAEGSYMADNQPQLFKAGGGTFDVYFSGSDLTWTISSMDNLNKSSVSVTANFCSSKCVDYSIKKSYKESDDEEITELPEKISIYPNPVVDRAMVQMNEDLLNDAILLFDSQGKIYNIEVNKVSNNGFEIDLAGKKPGLYFIRVNTVSSIKNIRIIKQ